MSLWVVSWRCTDLIGPLTLCPSCWRGSGPAVVPGTAPTPQAPGRLGPTRAWYIMEAGWGRWGQTGWAHNCPEGAAATPAPLLSFASYALGPFPAVSFAGSTPSGPLSTGGPSAWSWGLFFLSLDWLPEWPQPPCGLLKKYTYSQKLCNLHHNNFRIFLSPSRETPDPSAVLGLVPPAPGPGHRSSTSCLWGFARSGPSI